MAVVSASSARGRGSEELVCAVPPAWALSGVAPAATKQVDFIVSATRRPTYLSGWSTWSATSSNPASPAALLTLAHSAQAVSSAENKRRALIAV